MFCVCVCVTFLPHSYHPKAAHPSASWRLAICQQLLHRFGTSSPGRICQLTHPTLQTWLLDPTRQKFGGKWDETDGNDG